MELTDLTPTPEGWERYPSDPRIAALALNAKLASSGIKIEVIGNREFFFRVVFPGTDDIASRWFVAHNDYHEGNEMTWYELSEAEFKLLEPYRFDLSLGNGVGDAEAEALTEALHDRQPLNLTPEQIDAIPNDRWIEIAIV